MKKLYLLVLVILCAALAACASDSPTLCVFTGNSICDGWDDINPGLFKEHNIVNVGHSGETSRQILARFDTDVMAHSPAVVVIISPNTNDIAQNEGPVTQAQMVDNVRQMILRARGAGDASPRVILTSNLPASRFFWRPGMQPAPHIVEQNTCLRNLAHEMGVTYIDLHVLLADATNGLSETHSEDGVHPSLAGYKIMEAAIMPVVAEARAAARAAAK